MLVFLFLLLALLVPSTVLSNFTTKNTASDFSKGVFKLVFDRILVVSSSYLTQSIFLSQILAQLNHLITYNLFNKIFYDVPLLHNTFLNLFSITSLFQME